jgi:hypothetical protein
MEGGVEFTGTAAPVGPVEIAAVLTDHLVKVPVVFFALMATEINFAAWAAGTTYVAAVAPAMAVQAAGLADTAAVTRLVHEYQA